MSTDVNTGASAPPEDFASYEAFRRGDKPAEVENPSGATDETAAGSESDSETDKNLESLPAGDDAGGEGDEEEEEEEEEAPRPKKGKGGFQKRIEKLNARAERLEEENAELRRLAGENPAANEETKPAAAADGKPVRPKLADFATFEEHENALADYEERLADWKFEHKTREQTAKAEQSKAAEAWEGRTAKLRATHPDYDEKISALQIPNTPAVASVREAIGSSDVGPEILYHLASNPAEAKRILLLPPVRAVAELGKLEGKLTAAAAPKQKTKVTSAPDPVNPIGGKGKAGPKPLADVDFSEYEKRRKAGEKL